MLIGNELTEELLEKAAVQAADEMNPRSSLRASAEYRHEIQWALQDGRCW